MPQAGTHGGLALISGQNFPQLPRFINQQETPVEGGQSAQLSNPDKAPRHHQIAQQHGAPILPLVPPGIFLLIVIVGEHDGVEPTLIVGLHGQKGRPFAVNTGARAFFTKLEYSGRYQLPHAIFYGALGNSFAVSQQIRLGQPTDNPRSRGIIGIDRTKRLRN